jgi:uroporphyrinogen decarboxylase
MMLKDQMTPLERMKAFSEGKEIDRLPCFPFVGSLAAKVVGINVSELRDSGKVLANAHIQAYKTFGYDGLNIYTHLYTVAEAMGANVIHPLDEVPHLDDPLIEDIAEIDGLKMPDPFKDGQLPDFLEAVKIALDQVGKEVGVSTNIIGTLTTVSFILGTEKMSRMLVRNPEAVHKLCEMVFQANIKMADAVIDMGAGICLPEPLGSCTLISPKHSREFAFPYIKRIIDHCHSRGQGVTLHICGDTEKIWDDMVATGADCLSLDNVIDLSLAKQRVGDKVCLVGNIDPAKMLRSKAADIRSEIIDTVAKTYDSPKGYCISTGCDLPVKTPLANVHVLMNTAREIGYPITREKLQALKD